MLRETCDGASAVQVMHQVDRALYLRDDRFMLRQEYLAPVADKDVAHVVRSAPPSRKVDR